MKEPHPIRSLEELPKQCLEGLDGHLMSIPLQHLNPQALDPMRSSKSIFEFLTAAVLCGLLFASCSGNSDGAGGIKGSEQGDTGSGGNDEQGSTGYGGSAEQQAGRDVGATAASYAWVEINGQVWMTENLNVDKFRNGDPIPEVKSDEDWRKAGEEGKPAWCYYDNAPVKGKKFGRLYNWYAVSDPRGLAPKGWRIPSMEDWVELCSYFGKDAAVYLKSTEFDGGTNEGGFTALPGGLRDDLYREQFRDLNNRGYWWTLTPKIETGKIKAAEMWGEVNELFGGGIWNSVEFHSHEKSSGLSVRCIKE